MNNRKRLEQLCRHITGTALSDERIGLNPAGQVDLKLKTHWRDGTTHLVMIPLQFKQRLAELLPRLRLQLVRYPQPPPTGSAREAGLMACS